MSFSSFKSFGNQVAIPKLLNNIITIKSFTVGSNTFTIPSDATEIKILVVGGGGGGGDREGGGGGGGTVIQKSISTGEDIITINIGEGGNLNENGLPTTVVFQNNTENNINSIGGGGGGTKNSNGKGKDGGSGGGNSRDKLFNSSIGIIGKNGGKSISDYFGGASGGGGSALQGGKGGNTKVGNPPLGEYSGSGGDGIKSSITGLYYGGGGGGSNNGNGDKSSIFILPTSQIASSIKGVGLGGLGGGGNGASVERGNEIPQNGQLNTGGGGGGGDTRFNGNQGKGGSGIVIISYIIL
jgi:hypothetical protein